MGGGELKNKDLGLSLKNLMTAIFFPYNLGFLPNSFLVLLLAQF